MDTELIASTERCSDLDHTIILAAKAPHETGRDVCLTCSGIVAYQDGLRRWQDVARLHGWHLRRLPP